MLHINARSLVANINSLCLTVDTRVYREIFKLRISAIVWGIALYTRHKVTQFFSEQFLIVFVLILQTCDLPNHSEYKHADH